MLPMIHLQLTTACNMSCAHCNIGCSTDKRGDYMQDDVFNATIQNLPSRFYLITGGEPTLNKNLFKYIDHLLKDKCKVMVITNGKRTKDALKLLELMDSNNKFIARLSSDEYHDPIDPEVYLKFKNRNALQELTFIANQGSAKENKINTIPDGCACPVPTVTPLGILKKCGCNDSDVLGSVFDKTTTARADQYVQEVEALHGYFATVCYQDITKKLL